MNGGEFRIIRNFTGLSQEGLAREMGVSTGTIYNLEKRLEVPRLYELALRWIQAQVGKGN